MSAVPRSLKKDFPHLKKVFDAKQAVEVDVTARDVKGAKKGDAVNCAMARAMCREWKADTAVIGMGYSYIIKGNTAVRYRTPESVSREIVSFDRNRDFRPGKFRLSAVPPASRLDARRKPLGKKPPGKKHSPVRVYHTTSGVRHL